MNTITITPQLQQLIDRVYPDLTPRQQSGKIRGMIQEILLDRILNTPIAAPEPGAPPEPETATRAANRIARMAPSIDDQNWVKLESFIEQAKAAGLWDNPAELRLIARLNDPFDGAENEHRVQNSRITAFFRRLAA